MVERQIPNLRAGSSILSRPAKKDLTNPQECGKLKSVESDLLDSGESYPR